MRQRRRLQGIAAAAGGLFFGFSVAGTVWEWIAAGATREFFSQKEETGDDPAAEAEDLPRAAILMPLKGSSRANRASIESMLGQDYPNLEVIVGASDDPTIHFVEGLRRSHEGAPLRLAAGPNRLGGRPKVGNLQNALEVTDSPLIAMIDADVAAGPEFLRKLLAPLAQPGTGLTTCLYRSSRGGSLWSRVDGLWTSATFLPSALFGRRVIGEGFAFGAAIGIRRGVLDQIGGLRAIAHQVGDDYLLGRRTVEAGYRVQLVPYVVTEQSEEMGFREFVSRRARWSRTIRFHQTAGYVGMVVTYGVPFALLALALSPRSRGRWSWMGAVVGNRIACAHINRQLLDPEAPLMELALVPLRDVVALGIWFMGFAPARVGPGRAPLLTEASARSPEFP